MRHRIGAIVLRTRREGRTEKTGLAHPAARRGVAGAASRASRARSHSTIAATRSTSGRKTLTEDGAVGERARNKALAHPGLAIVEEEGPANAPIRSNPKGLRNGYNPYESGLLAKKGQRKKSICASCRSGWKRRRTPSPTAVKNEESGRSSAS